MFELNKNIDIDNNLVRGYYKLNDKDDFTLLIGIYHINTGTSGEFEISWENLAGDFVPKLISYDDSWLVLSHFDDLIKEMSKVDDENITKEEFCEILNKLGIIDLTEYYKSNSVKNKIIEVINIHKRNLKIDNILK